MKYNLCKCFLNLNIMLLCDSLHLGFQMTPSGIAGALDSWRTEEKGHIHIVYKHTYTSNINRHLTRNSCAELFSKSLSSWNQPDWVGKSSNVPHEAFRRLCRRARTRAGKWGNRTAHPILSVSVPADPPALLTLCKITCFYLWNIQADSSLEHSGGINQEEIQIRLDQRKRKPQTSAWE